MLNSKDNTNKILIGITGASASGKSLFANKLQKLVGEHNCLLVSQDNFYKTPPKGTDMGNYNFDEPSAIDYDSFVDYLNSLIKNNIGKEPIYSFESHSRIGERLVTFEGKFIIIEGIFSLNDKRLIDLMDLRIFIDTGLDICLTRRIERDIEERGRDLKSIINQYHKFVRPGYFNYIAPKKNTCDIVVPNEEIGQYQRALHIVGKYMYNI